jgi:hypothetical protein
VATLPRLVADMPALGLGLTTIEVEERLPLVRLSAFARASTPLTPAAQHLYDTALNLACADRQLPPASRRGTSPALADRLPA